jgi:hypothetical protein
MVMKESICVSTCITNDFVLTHHATEEKLFDYSALHYAHSCLQILAYCPIYKMSIKRTKYTNPQHDYQQE